MNDQHPHAGYAGDGAHTTGGFAADPLFGSWSDPGQTGHSGQWDLGQYAAGGTYGTTGAYDTAVAHDTAVAYDTTGQWDTTGGWDTTGRWTAAPAAPEAADLYAAAPAYGQPAPYDTTGQWDATAWTEAQHTGPYETLHSGAYAAHGAYGHEAYDATGQWAAPAFATDTGAYDATAWNQVSDPAEPVVPQQYSPQPERVDQTAEFAFPHEPDAQEPKAHGAAAAHDSETYEAEAYGPDTYEPEAYASGADAAPEAAGEHADDAPEAPAPAPEVRTDASDARPARRSSGGSRARRRTPAKRSALLTVAVPSACVMGVAGIAAASVGGLTGSGDEGTKQKDTTALAAADPAAVKPIAANTAVDTQLSALDAGVRDFGDRASRTQERIDLKVRQAAEKKKREEEAARREALRPKFSLPVKLHQLSARFGQSGVNWMSVHTGIDFPVMTGTPVMAATDGTVRTQLNYAYGNMVILTAPDGTETWYCHLSGAKYRSGTVKAGEVIAYSGDSGNSTGPHLHFEVRPGGGSAIDPLAWLRSKGLDPTS
ncbi:M23 family metallopeptidase [Streptomyces griseus]|uniref:M23 family metallopeptidase n=1 Tax=Streptomyces griseus TaxID=1911 RepID=UPI0004C8AB50|nr:M23 family metallopeptidase [Streptomyces griseus]